MAVTLHNNNAVGYLLNPVAPGDTTIVLQAGQGARFPAIVSGEQFYVTVENRAVLGSMEIMLCTARTLDSLVVLRGRQGTTAISFAAGVSVSNRVTADFLNEIDARIDDATTTSEAAAVAAATALAAATSANSGLALKANIASPALTGVPTAQTAAPGTSTTQLATTAFVAAAVAAGGGGGGGANLDSPAFTGNPTAPTPTAGDNDTTIATTAFVTAAVTLGITGLAPLASPTFTGAPLAPTPSAGDNTVAIATTAFVNTAIVGKANLAGPTTFTGVTSGVTASPGTNTTQLATTAFVTAAVAAGGGGSSSTPDPLVWAKLDSPIFVNTPAAPTATPGTATTQIATTAFVTAAVTTGVSGLASIASPTFTGDPKAPTPTVGDNDTSIATTAFVTTAVAGVTKTSIGLGNVDNTTDVGKPISTATQTALNLKAPLASPVFTGTATVPDQGAGTNTGVIANTKFVTTGLALKANLASPIFTGVPSATTPATATDSTQLATTAYVKAQGYVTTAGIMSAIGSAFVGDDGALIVVGGNVSTEDIVPATGATNRFMRLDGSGAYQEATTAQAIAALSSTTESLGVLAIEVGHASDTTVGRRAAGRLSVEGVALDPDIPISDVGTAKTFTLAEMNRGWRHPPSDATARIWTIPSNASVAAGKGSFLTFVNDVGAGVITIALTTDTLIWSPSGGTGSRTLAAGGMATAYKVDTNRWFISGSGLT